MAAHVRNGKGKKNVRKQLLFLRMMAFFGYCGINNLSGMNAGQKIHPLQACQFFCVNDQTA